MFEKIIHVGIVLHSKGTNVYLGQTLDEVQAKIYNDYVKPEWSTVFTEERSEIESPNYALAIGEYFEECKRYGINESVMYDTDSVCISEDF